MPCQYHKNKKQKACLPTAALPSAQSVIIVSEPARISLRWYRRHGVASVQRLPGRKVQGFQVHAAVVYTIYLTLSGGENNYASEPKRSLRPPQQMNRGRETQQRKGEMSTLLQTSSSDDDQIPHSSCTYNVLLDSFWWRKYLYVAGLERPLRPQQSSRETKTQQTTGETTHYCRVTTDRTLQVLGY